MESLGKRDLRSLLWIAKQKETYSAIINAFRVLPNAQSLIWREVFSSASASNREVEVRSPIGRLKVQLRHSVDLSTLFGIFCREDYKISRGAPVVVDIGANIGLASLYFLSRSAGTRVYAFEPVPENIDLYELNLANFRGRYELQRCAVDRASGTVEFGVESTGKFGGIGVAGIKRIVVSAIGINDLLRSVLAKHSEISCLKIDVEGLEGALISAIDADLWPKIACVYAENVNSSAHVPESFSREWRYNVEKLIRRD